MLNCLCRTRGFPKELFIDLLVLVLHMVREIWRETDRIKAGKNFKVTEQKFSNVTALNGLAKFYCITVSADRTLQIYATICIFQIRNLSYTDVTHITRVTFVRNTKSLEIGNMPLKSSELLKFKVYTRKIPISLLQIGSSPSRGPIPLAYVIILIFWQCLCNNPTF